MPSIFVSNAGTGRCVPDVVGLGFTVAVQNGTAAGLIGGTNTVKVTPLAAPQLGSCGSSGRAWRLWAVQHSQSGVQPLGGQPPSRVLKRVASKIADSLCS